MNIISHKIRIKPRRSQYEKLARCAGTARFVYNWGLANWKKQYESGDKPNCNKLKRQLTQLKKTDLGWLKDVPQAIASNAMNNLGIAYKRFFKTKKGFPKFKKRGCRESFTPVDHRLRVDSKDKKIRIRGLGVMLSLIHI